jgi:hypothetical protein
MALSTPKHDARVFPTTRLAEQLLCRCGWARPRRRERYIVCLAALELRFVSFRQKEKSMAWKYSRSSQKEVKGAMHEFKRGKLKSGRSGKKVKNRKQAIAIGLSKARKKGAKVPKRKSA